MSLGGTPVLIYQANPAEPNPNNEPDCQPQDPQVGPQDPASLVNSLHHHYQSQLHLKDQTIHALSTEIKQLSRENHVCSKTLVQTLESGKESMREVIELVKVESYREGMGCS